MVEIIWNDKTYHVSEIKMSKEPFESIITIIFKSGEILSDLREKKLQEILYDKGEDILSRTLLQFIRYDVQGFVYKKLLVYPNEIKISTSDICVISDFWKEMVV